jgi:hypothetical protein
MNEYAGIRFALFEVEIDEDFCNEVEPVGTASIRTVPFVRDTQNPPCQALLLKKAALRFI